MQSIIKPTVKSRLSLIVGAGAFVLTAVVGMIGGVQLGYIPTAGALDDKSAQPEQTKATKAEPTVKWATRDFPTNENGQTYGSDAEATTLEEAPDLVAVVGDAGKLGFVLKEDLWLDGVDSPEEAAAYEQRLAVTGPASMRVYDLDGNVIDHFTPVLGEVNSGPRIEGVS